MNASELREADLAKHLGTLLPQIGLTLIQEQVVKVSCDWMRLLMTRKARSL
jgi:hypothetical protein